MKNISSLLILFLIANNVVSQVQPDRIRPVISSPTSAELSKQANISANLSTGIVNTIIPIYTINSGELEVPVCLSYVGSGIKADQIASNVGLGWSLKAGGLINIQIIGRSDIESTYRIVKNFDDIKNKKYPESSQLDKITRLYVNQQTIYATHDSEPDLFTYNFCNYSGNFVVDTDFKAHQLVESKDLFINIDKTNKSIRITDNKGVVYDFSRYERTSSTTHLKYFDVNGRALTNSQTDPFINKSVITTFYLTKMTSPDSKRYIKFNYTPESTKFQTPVSASIVMQGNSFAYPWRGYSGDCATYSDITNNSYKLSSIETSEGNRIIFNYSHKRSDIEGDAKALTNIQLYNSNTVVKSWTLSYDYFTARFSSPNSFLNKRLKLTEIKNNETLTKHSFKYYGESRNTPHRNAFGGKDKYGYFNGSETGYVRHLFPKLNNFKVPVPLEYKPGVPNDILVPNIGLLKEFTQNFSSGSNQEVNREFTDTYSLKEIYYPTGGHTTFIYEPNSYSYINTTTQSVNSYFSGLRIKSIVNYINNKIVSNKSYSYNCSMRPNYSSGTIGEEPRFWTLKRYQKGSSTFTDYLLCSVPYNSIYSATGDYIVYKNVQESDGAGEIKHYFYSFYTYPSEFNAVQLYLYYKNNTTVSSSYLSTNPSIHFSKKYGGMHFLRGAEHYTEYFDSNKKRIKTESIKYKYPSNIKSVYGMAVINCSPNVSQHFDLNIYYYPIAPRLIASKTIFTSNVQKIEEYTYNEQNLLSKKETINSDGVKKTKTITYPNDYKFNYFEGQPHPLTVMAEKKMWNYPIETKSYANEYVTDLGITTYMQDQRKTGVIKPSGYYRLNTQKPLPDFTALMEGGGSIAYKFDPRISDEFKYTYYESGNLKEVINVRSGFTTTYYWSYNWQYPVAVIENASYDLISSYYGKAFSENLGKKAFPDTKDIDNLNMLKNYFLNTSITTFLYKPLIGIITKTAPNGTTTHYEYDSSGRVKEISILENGVKKVIQSYDYHYQQQ